MKGMKFNLILLIILAVVAAFFFWDQERTEQIEQQEEQEAQLTALESEEVSSVKVINSYDTISAQKVDENWRIVEPINASGDDSQWNMLITSIAQGERQRVIENNPEDLSKYGLSQPAVEVVLSGTGEQSSRIAFGNKTPVSGKHYAFIHDSSDVVTVSTTLFNNADKTLYDFRDKTILALDTEEVQKMEINHESLQLTVQKENDQWIIQEPIVAQANATLIEDFINQINDTEIKQFIEENPNIYDAYGLVDPATKITFWSGNPQDESSWASKALLLGTTNESQYTYAKRAADNNVFAIEQKAYNKIPTSLEEIRMTKLTPLRSWEVNQIKINAPDLVFSATKSGSDWLMTQPNEGQLDYNKVSSITKSLVELEVGSFVQSSTAEELLDNPQVVAELRSTDTNNVLKFTPAPDQDVYYGVRQNPTEYFTIDKAKIEDIINNVKDLEVQEETETVSDESAENIETMSNPEQ